MVGSGPLSVLSSSQKDLSISTLVSLSAPLPNFQHPFTKTSTPASPEIATASDEESLDKARSCLMEGMHLLNEVSARTQTCIQILASKQLNFEECFQAMKRLQEIHDQLEGEAQRLQIEVSGLSERNQELVKDLSESLGHQEELSNSNQDLQLQADDLEISWSGKDVCIKLLEDELSNFKVVIAEKDA
ncbi:unnamed protein product [Lactuca virosa]|uniref:Uncharacterized protein n=1 Tax=Lactuca virosa TaxID=75947 RepID=A0AAU9M7R3_9ASTR|nr:unnamed protein product [Lactuca virosa]